MANISIQNDVLIILHTKRHALLTMISQGSLKAADRSHSFWSDIFMLLKGDYRQRKRHLFSSCRQKTTPWEPQDHRHHYKSLTLNKPNPVCATYQTLSLDLTANRAKIARNILHSDWPTSRASPYNKVLCFEPHNKPIESWLFDPYQPCDQRDN